MQPRKKEEEMLEYIELLLVLHQKKLKKKDKKNLKQEKLNKNKL